FHAQHRGIVSVLISCQGSAGRDTQRLLKGGHDLILPKAPVLPVVQPRLPGCDSIRLLECHVLPLPDKSSLERGDLRSAAEVADVLIENLHEHLYDWLLLLL